MVGEGLEEIQRTGTRLNMEKILRMFPLSLTHLVDGFHFPLTPLTVELALYQSSRDLRQRQSLQPSGNR